MSLLTIFGLVLYLVGWIWLIVRAGKEFGWLWALIVLFFSLLGGLIFCILKKRAWLQWAIAAVGWAIMMLATVMATRMVAT